MTIDDLAQKLQDLAAECNTPHGVVILITDTMTSSVSSRSNLDPEDMIGLFIATAKEVANNDPVEGRA